MAELSIDRFSDLYAGRTTGMAASEVRALFAVASRPEVISLAGGMPHLGDLPPEHVLDVVSKVLADHGAGALQYVGGQGHLGLRECLVALMAESGVAADPEDVVVTTGAQQGLDIIGKLFIDPGDPIVVESPSYVGALSAFSAYEPRYVQVDIDEHGMVVEQLEEALVQGLRPKFVYTCPTFGNPAGVTMSHARRRRLVELCRGAGVPILEDDPYGLLRYEGEPSATLRSMDPENVIYLGTVSKIFSPGVRVGWVLAEPSVIQRVTLAKEASDLCGSSFNMFVTQGYFADDRWRTNLERLIDTYRDRRDAMLAAIEEHFPADTSWTHPAGGFYIWVTLPDWTDTRALLAAAVERRVAYTPGTAFYPDGSGRHQMRLSFSHPAVESIREGTARLGELLAEEEARYRSLRR
jgi:DNA-binding transcriptional MocR family regulator